MSLIKKKSQLTDLKFGKDRPGGGSSKQPYIITNPQTDKNNTFISNLFDNSVLKIERSAKDVSRISQWFFDTSTPSGYSFILNQNLLSRQTSDLRAGYKTFSAGSFSLPGGIYNPANTIIQVGEVAFGAHYNKQGLIPSKNKGLIGDAINFLDKKLGTNISNSNINQPNYIDFYKNNGDNPGYFNSRLEYLHKSKGYELTSTFLRKRVGGDIIYSYFGGPNSLKTDIKFYQDSITDKSIYHKTKKSPNTSYNYRFINPLSSRYLGDNNKITGINDYRHLTNQNRPIITFHKNENEVEVKYDGKTYYKKQNYQFPHIQDFRNINDKDFPEWGGVKPIDSIQSNARIQLNDPTHRLKGLLEKDKIKKYNFTNTDYIVDKINMSGLSPERGDDDLIKFRIGVLDRITQKWEYIRFRAYIDLFSDNYSSDINEHKFMGRGERFFKYNGFDREISLNFTVAALSKPELIPIYKKLNYLASCLAPDYGNNGYMSGNIMNLTVGGYVYETPGILSNINIAPLEDTPWEIGVSYGSGTYDHSVKELPMVVKVTGFKFKPIHTFTPKIQKDYNKGIVRFISLDAGGKTNNYDYE